MAKILDGYLEKGYSYKIEKASLSKSAVLTVEVGLDFVVPFDVLPKMKEELRGSIEGVSDVKIIFHYGDMAESEKDIIDEYIPYLKVLTERSGGAMAQSLSGEYELRDGELVIFVVGKIAEQVLNENLSAKFSKILNESFGLKVRVCFENSEEKLKNTKEAIEKHMADASVPENRPSRKSGKSGQAKLGSHILGRAPKGDIVSIASLRPDSGVVVCEGDVFSIDSRAIKNQRVIATVLFTDYETSMAAKFFVKEDKWELISDALKEGDRIRVGGNAELDSYTHELVIMAKSIEKIQKETRTDDAEEKRVELHCHTKMSAMDGLNDVGHIVRLAKSWGQKALAITDHGVCQALPEAYTEAKGDIKIILGVEGYLYDDEGCIEEDGTINYKKKNTNHIIILARTQEGLKNLYKLVSDSHLHYFYKKPRIPRSVLDEYREGLILGSACEAGELYRAVEEHRTEEEIERIAGYYDYLEIQPLCNNQFLINNGRAEGIEELQDNNRKIIEIGHKLGKPVVATTDAHYGAPEEALYRNILLSGQGFKDAGSQGLYMRTTDEMLEEFSYLGDELAKEVVIDAPNKVADMIDDVRPVPEEKYPPTIPHSDEILRDSCEKKAKEIYGDPLPDKIGARLEKELSAIIGNGYSVMYVSAKMLVEKSNSDGYLVGSRGSVGSSFAATMSGITEVNPLAPHYICPKCKKLIWGDSDKYQTGIDMPDMECPDCGTRMKRDGFNIPFETFLGFTGNKEPDIDLNFAGEYQATAHRYVGEIFGEENVFKAGTVGTIASKTAYGFVMKYYEEKGIPVNRYEVERLTEACTGVKRTTGQHPGGIVIVPRGHSIYEFCPVQRPANDTTTDITTTHFDYHKIDHNLLKLDILGHDVPSMIRHLQDMTGQDPLDVPLDDKETMEIFTGIEGLDIKDTDYRFTHGTYGIPEFGTKFVRQMLDDTKPKKFADLIRISGFSHGTNVWLNNAQEYIKSGEATMDDAISTRDDIMNYLISKGVPDADAFQIMEKVRKGKGVTEERADIMMEHDVPQWYLDSCRKISYMFPRAHAVAYVMMSFRIAYYKVHYPAEFYAVYLTTKITDFNWEVISRGKQAVLDRMDEISMKGNNATAKENDEVTVLEIVYEMFARGYEFEDPSLEGSEAVRFGVRDGRVVVPLCGLTGVGANVARSVKDEQAKRPFATIEDMQGRAGVNKTAVQAMREYGLLEGMPESDQLSFFSM